MLSHEWLIDKVKVVWILSNLFLLTYSKSKKAKNNYKGLIGHYLNKFVTLSTLWSAKHPKQDNKPLEHLQQDLVFLSHF